MRKSTFVIALSIILSGTSVTLAQAIEDPVCTASFSQLVVEQQIDDSRNVDSRKRVKVLIRAADFLWGLDQDAARRYFTEAYTKASEHFKDKGFEIQKFGAEAGGLQGPLSDLRTDVIRAVTKHDPEWAGRLTDELLAEYEKAKADRKDADKEKEPIELLMMAGEASKTNPAFAAFLYRRAMKYPLNYAWIFSLNSLAGSDQSLGDQIYSEALFNYRNEAPSKLLFLSAYPFGSQRIMGIDKMSYGSPMPAAFTPNIGLQRQFILTFFDRATAVAADPSVFQGIAANSYPPPEPVYISSALADIEPLIITDHPELLARFGVVKSQASALLNDDMQARIEGSNKRRETAALTIEERVKAATEADANGKLTDDQIVGLITSPLKTDDHFKLVEPFLAKIKEEKLRGEATGHFWTLRTELAISDKRLKDAEKFAVRIPELDHRSVMMFRMVDSQFKESLSTADAFETLNSLSKLTRSSPNSVAKAQVLLGLATYYTKVNRSLAIDELSEAVRVINRLPEGSYLLTTQVVRHLRTKNGAFYMVMTLPGANLESVFLEASRQGLEVPLAVARGIDDRYFRILAVLAIAKNCQEKVRRTADPVK